MWFQKRPSVTIGTWGLPYVLRLPFQLGPDKLRMHHHVMGVTGQGKSKYLALLAASLIEQGVGTSILDPHADLAADVLRLLYHRGYFSRPDAYEKLWYVDFSRKDRFLPFNCLKQPYDAHTIARNLVETCKRAWPALGEGAAPNFENILLVSALVLAENGLPLTALNDLLTKKDEREKLLAKPGLDPVAISFFHDRFDKWGKDAPVLIESTLRRALLLSFTQPLRYTLGQSENRLNFGAIMDQGISVLYDLSGLDDETQSLLGCLLTIGYEKAALARKDLPERQRRLHRLIIDEFSQFCAQSETALSKVLSQTRKYGLFLTMAHQTWNQLDARLQGAMQNCLRMIFQLGREDAMWAAPRFGNYDPYAIKHEVKDETADKRTHPVFFSLGETWEQWAEEIENLTAREALVRLPPKKLWEMKKLKGRTYQIKITKAEMSRCSEETLAAIKDTYAKLLLRPVEALAQPRPGPEPPRDETAKPAPATKRIALVA